MNQILSGLPVVVSYAFSLYEFIIFVYCLLSFVPALYNSAFGRLVVSMVAPFLNLIKRVIPTSFGMLDFSPIIALILIQLLQKVVFMII